MAKARGNKLIPPTNYSRNPMAMQQPVPFSPLQSSAVTGPSMLDARIQASSIRNSANQINSLVARSQVANPMVPQSPGFEVVNPDAESARRLAPMLAQDAARQQNTPMNGMTAYEANPMRYRPGDPAIQARQLDNAQRATMGQPMDRTRDGGALNAYISAGGTPWYERERQARDQMAMQARQSTPEFQAAMAAMQQQKTAREALRDRSNLNVPQAELDRRNDADTARREREARHNRFKDASGGMNYKQYDRLQRQNALTMKAVDEGRLSPEAANFRMQTRADKALRRAGNPMAMGDANRGRLFPDMLAGKGGRAASPAQNPMLAAFEPGAQNTPEGNALRDQMKVELAQSSPSLSAMGVAPDTDPNTFAGSIAAYNGDLTDEGLTEIHNFAKTFMGGQDGTTPFDNAQNMMAAPEMLAELWRLPVGTPPQKLREWFNKYRQETQSRLNRAKQNMQTSPAWTVG